MTRWDPYCADDLKRQPRRNIKSFKNENKTTRCMHSKKDWRWYQSNLEPGNLGLLRTRSNFIHGSRLLVSSTGGRWLQSEWVQQRNLFCFIKISSQGLGSLLNWDIFSVNKTTGIARHPVEGRCRTLVSGSNFWYFGGGYPGPGSGWRNLATPPASKEAESPSNMVLLVLFVHGWWIVTGECSKLFLCQTQLHSWWS